MEEFEDISEEKEDTVEDLEDVEDKIIIHVTGAVINEGIVEVKENARINDVIEAAGGLRDDADLKDVNLAYSVEDGQKIYIPSKNEVSEDNLTKEIITDGPGESVINEESGETGELININTANQEKLKELPGIRGLNSRKDNNI